MRSTDRLPRLHTSQHPKRQVWVLFRDGNEIMRDTEIAAWDYIHSRHGFSVSHALKYEGYKLVRVY